MRISLAFAGLMVCAFMANAVLAQDGAVVTANNYQYYEVQASPSDLPDVIGGGKAGCGCDNAKGCKGDCGDFCEPWRLFPNCGNWNITGWAAVGATANADNPASRYNGPMTFNDRDEVQVNQLYAVIENPIDNSGCGWDWGARVDLLFGTDYIFTQEIGWETTQAGAPKWNNRSHYGLAMPQAYVEVQRDDINLKLGRFYTIIGYESVMAPQNFFYSHAYTMQYGEPFTHTGALATWDYSCNLDFMAGIVNGWDRFDGVTDRMGFLGGMIYTPDHGIYSIAFTIISDTEESLVMPGTFHSRNMYSLVFTYDVSDRTQYVLQHDAGRHSNALGANADAEWYGINQYLFYTLNDCYKVGARFEWFRDDDGTRVAGVRAGNPYAGGNSGNFYEMSVGLNWTPCSNLMVRPEIRWDWYEGAGPMPFDDGTKNEQFTAAVDAIIVF